MENGDQQISVAGESTKGIIDFEYDCKIEFVCATTAAGTTTNGGRKDETSLGFFGDEN